MISISLPLWFAAMSATYATATNAAPIFAERPSLHKKEAIAIKSAAHSTAFGAPSRLRTGTRRRQARAPPIRSKPYKRETSPVGRAKTTEKIKPVIKKGIADTRYINVSFSKLRSSKFNDTAECNTSSRTPSINSALAPSNTPPNCCTVHREIFTRKMCAKTPPAPRPSRATEIARNAK